MALGDKGEHYMTRCGTKKRLNGTERLFYLDNTNHAQIFSRNTFLKQQTADRQILN